MIVIDMIKFTLEERKRIKKYCGMDESQLLNLSDEELYIAIDTRIDVEAYDLEVPVIMQKLCPEKRNFYVINCFTMEVNNGGLCQYFVNSSRDTAPYLQEALKSIGAKEHLELLRDFTDKNNINLNDLSSFIIDDIEEYESQCDRFPFDEFDDKYYELDDEISVDEKICIYIRENISKFI